MTLRRTPPAGKLIARLLHYANAEPPLNRTEFYALKERLLRKHGRFCGHELQEIKKECWGDRWWVGQYDHDDGHNPPIPCGPKCTRCGGTGIYDIRWVRLERWEWCGYVFHRPTGDTRIPPEIGSVRIFGRIEHPNYGRLGREAGLWLFVLCGEWRLLWHTLRGSCMAYPGWCPMLRLQKFVMNACMYLRWQRCFCGKRFPTWGSGRQMCRKCYSRPVEVPF